MAAPISIHLTLGNDESIIAIDNNVSSNSIKAAALTRMIISSNIQQDEHADEMAKQESPRLTSMLKTVDLGGQDLASLVHFYKGEYGVVMGWDGQAELSDSLASDS